MGVPTTRQTARRQAAAMEAAEPRVGRREDQEEKEARKEKEKVRLVAASLVAGPTTNLVVQEMQAEAKVDFENWAKAVKQTCGRTTA